MKDMERVWVVSMFLMALVLLSNGLILVAMLWALGKIHSVDASELRVLVSDEGPALHSHLPDFAIQDLDDNLVSNAGLRGREVVLLLLSPGCSPCDRLLKELRATIRAMRYCPELFIILEGTPQFAQEYVRRYNPPARVAADEAANVRTQLGIASTPYAFLVDEEGIVRMKGVVDTTMRLEGLAARRGRFVSQPGWHVVNSETS